MQCVVETDSGAQYNHPKVTKAQLLEMTSKHYKYILTKKTVEPKRIEV